MEKVSNDTDIEGPEPISLLSGVGDRELWYAESGRKESSGGDGGPMWRFPLYVDWKIDGATGAEYAMVYPALCPHYKATLVLKAFFESHDKLNQEGRWLINKTVVFSALKKAPGITPDRYYRWDGKEAKAILFTEKLKPGAREPSHLKGPFNKDRALIGQIAEACGLQSSVVKIVIDGLNSVAADFLVAQHRPMDLGFVKLIAVPFRANWKEIVCFKLRKLGLLNALKGEDHEHESKAAENRGYDGNSLGLPETLCSPHNIAIRRERPKKGPVPLSRVDYNIEAITSKAFEAEVTRLETKNRALGHTSYVGYYEKTVEKLYENLLEILRAYRKKIGYPFARVLDSSFSGGLRFVETIGIRARAHGRNLRNLPVHIVAPRRGFSAAAESSQSELVYSPAVEVSKVPAFSRPLDDLRQRQELGALEELGNREGGTGGVSLPDVDKGQDAGEPMLLESTTGGKPSWVEIIGD